MIFSQLGIVAFFGLLVPGAYLLASMLLVATVLAIEFELVNLDHLRYAMEQSLLLSSTAFLLISYLLGVLMRLVGPNTVDRLSTWYFRYIVRAPDDEENCWMYEEFPYPISTKKMFEKKGLEYIGSFFMNKDERFFRERNSDFFNYCKMILEGNNVNISRITTQAESMVRFLAGTSIAFLISSFVWAIVSIALAFFALTLSLYCAIAATVSVLPLWPIVARFKFQRLREVALVWSGTYLVLTGGVPNTGEKSPEDLQRSAFG